MGVNFIKKCHNLVISKSWKKSGKKLQWLKKLVAEMIVLSTKTMFNNEKSIVLGGWINGWMGGWMDVCKSRFKDCLQQSKTSLTRFCTATSLIKKFEHVFGYFFAN